MKTFNRNIKFAAAGCLTLSLLLTACGAPAVSPLPSPTAQAVESPAVTQSAELFTPGTWLSDKGQYYFFDDNGSSGRTSSLTDGTGVGFEYTLTGDEADFAMGGADNSSKCSVTRSGDELTLVWDGGITEKLTYVSAEGSDSFVFYSNNDLADMALAYYKATSGEDDADLVSAAETNEDGSVTIQVYKNLGDHNSNAAWYTIDRLTATGTDSFGSSVDLTPYAES